MDFPGLVLMIPSGQYQLQASLTCLPDETTERQHTGSEQREGARMKREMSVKEREKRLERERRDEREIERVTRVYVKGRRGMTTDKAKEKQTKEK